MNTVVKALLIIMLTPLALSIGLESCTVAHVAAVTHPTAIQNFFVNPNTGRSLL